VIQIGPALDVDGFGFSLETETLNNNNNNTPVFPNTTLSSRRRVM